MSNSITVMAIDPGETTGLAWGTFDLQAGEGIKDVLLQGKGLGHSHIAGSELFQAGALIDRWERLGVDTHIVIENFILRPKIAHAGVEGLSPIRVTWAFVGALMERCIGSSAASLGESEYDTLLAAGMPPITYQTPAAAKSFGKESRLRRWGLWDRTVGHRHARDAYRHMALYVAQKG